jgi:4-amino-4-deoxy-L-arabinose transferase-like glycosyltransferase
VKPLLGLAVALAVLAVILEPRRRRNLRIAEVWAAETDPL